MKPSRRTDAAAGSWTEAEVVRLVRDHQGALAAYLRALGCPEAQVEDLVQDSFLRFLGSDFEGRGPGAERAYLRRIAYHRLVDSKRRPHLPTSDDVEALDRAWDGFDGEDGGERYLEALRRCLAKLAQRSRQVLELRYRDGLPRPAIAQQVGLSLGGVKSILLRAKAQLRTCVEREVEA